MKKDTDSDAIFSISMGAVGGTQITDKHTITIDNVQLKEVDSIDNDENNSNDDTNDNTSGSSIVNNGDFGKGFEGAQYVDESIKNGATFNQIIIKLI
jgi:BRCT domain type II-containing protein